MPRSMTLGFDPDNFYTGTHKDGWLKDPRFRNVPLFVSVRTVWSRKTLPVAVGRHAWDSSGFTEVKMNGTYTFTEEEYIAQIRRLMRDVGTPDFVSPMDWMCEEPVIYGLNQHLPKSHPAYFHGTREARGIEPGAPDEPLDSAVLKHQTWSRDNGIRLHRAAPDIPFIYVLQGQRFPQYVRHYEMYQDVGIDLADFPRVGLGSVCRRHTPEELRELEELIRYFSRKGIRLHGFGMKSRALTHLGGQIFSADSMAWSYDARQPKQKPLPGCFHGKTGQGKCANCPLYALYWRARLLDRLTDMQPVRDYGTRTRWSTSIPA